MSIQWDPMVEHREDPDLPTCENCGEPVEGPGIEDGDRILGPCCAPRAPMISPGLDLAPRPDRYIDRQTELAAALRRALAVLETAYEWAGDSTPEGVQVRQLAAKLDNLAADIARRAQDAEEVTS